ncbi:hypothetical protein FN846DRAFT_966033 [Sphaerosporella brunnea]|uniref:ubiquitinyl hydrolase 1 n=1 Tax=Sphaerosporella brunnea TaxID=1250544 RepID=A0A5J5EKM4_9PEZI|nr:hypothetical protein FN846DRAFT_966033 [Sphaerosporella brunnea]
MPSSYSRSSYHYRPPPPPPPSYQYQTLYHSAPADIDIGAILTTVGAAVVVIYLALGQYVALPTPLDAIAAMAGALFGPEYREKLQNAFAKTPGQVVSQAASIVGIAPTAVEGGVVGGLWNVGNTCYQNSVLQSLASLGALKPWLAAIGDGVAATTLHELVDSLNMVSERKRVETASSLITARGWMRNEQQDAQEYLQGLMGVLEKEVLAVEKLRKQAAALGLEHILEGQERPVEVAQPNAALRSPFEGLLAQRVGCLKCGYVDSISLQPFTTLSLPIPERVWRTSLENCIHAFTAIEKIEGVHCEKCTLLSIRDGLQTLLTLLPPSEDTPSTTEIETEPLPDAFRDIATERLNAINQALEDDNFTPKIAGVNLDGPRKVLSTKTKQVMIARAPPVLVLHANRSQFDLFTGVAGKNHAAINFPLILDLAQLGAVTRHEEISVRPGMPISPPPVEDASGEATYELKAVVVHYGGHHNGHYVAYRRWAGRWWRISDHEVVYVPPNLLRSLGADYFPASRRKNKYWLLITPSCCSMNASTPPSYLHL